MAKMAKKISENDDGTLNVHWDEWGSEYSMVRSELIINKKYLDPNYVEEVVIAPVAAPLRHKKYAVSIPVPADSQFVPKDAKLKPNTKVILGIYLNENLNQNI